jgi:hypothetical protein
MKEYIEGFFTLSSCRTYGMAMNPISFADIAAYMMVFPPLDKYRFVKYIKQMDNAFITTVQKQQESKK